MAEIGVVYWLRLPVRLPKEAATVIAGPLTYIFNLLLEQTTVPIEWKRARITPIYKEGDTSDPSNYRPIAILPVCMKMFERAVHDQLYSHMTNNALFSMNQSGFRPKHSTATTLINVTDYILWNMDCRK